MTNYAENCNVYTSKIVAKAIPFEFAHGYVLSWACFDPPDMRFFASDH